MLGDLENSIEKLNLNDNICNVLVSNNVVSIYDLWIMKRKDLKKMGLRDSEIKSIIISLQLMGLDLNGKKYN